MGEAALHRPQIEGLKFGVEVGESFGDLPWGGGPVQVAPHFWCVDRTVDGAGHGEICAVSETMPGTPAGCGAYRGRMGVVVCGCLVADGDNNPVLAGFGCEVAATAANFERSAWGRPVPDAAALRFGFGGDLAGEGEGAAAGRVAGPGEGNGEAEVGST